MLPPEPEVIGRWGQKPIHSERCRSTLHQRAMSQLPTRHPQQQCWRVERFGFAIHLYRYKLISPMKIGRVRVRETVIMRPIVQSTFAVLWSAVLVFWAAASVEAAHESEAIPLPSRRVG
jgi:hypothetical protein